MESYGPNTLSALANLIAPKSDSESDDDQPSNYYAKLNPAHIGAPKSQESSGDSEAKSLAARKKDDKDIWDVDEVNEGEEHDDIYDTRTSPDYEIIYKQVVGSEDVFLGMSNRTPATSSCEDMLIRIKLPGAIFKDVNVDLSDKYLNIRSPKYKLGLHLPHPCDSQNGRAKWVSDKEFLEISVRMKREYDFINF